MAITALDIDLWRELKNGGHLPVHPTVIEIGEANWYGDVDPLEVKEIAGLAKLVGKMTAHQTFRLAKGFYKAILDYQEMTAIDLHGTEKCIRHDLNLPMANPNQFDVLINTGTLEHVFDQRQAWQTCHELVKVGGLMAHKAPISGWPEHGFYSFNQTLVDDLEEVNGYQRLLLKTGKLINGGKELGTDLVWAWRKVKEQPFQIPRQGAYQAKGYERYYKPR